MDMIKYLRIFCMEFVDNINYESRFFAYALPLWIVGVLGNLVNVAVFRHKNMAHPINSIFLWLSISDLLELAVIALYQWNCVWCGWLQILNHFNGYKNNINECELFLISQYLLQVFHTITIGLNIMLVFCQYTVVAHPLINQKNPFSKQFIKYAIIWTYVLSFVLYLPFYYVNTIQPEDDLRRNFKPCTTELRTYHVWSMRGIFILICGVVWRIGPLIILIILCTMLLFAINNAHHKRRDLGMEARQLSKAERKVNRMNVTITIVVAMFLITEVPIAISALSLLLSRNLFLCSLIIEYYSLLPGMLFNCSYSIFCYLIRIKEYRETLKLLLNQRNWIISRARIVEQTDLELQPL